MVTPTDASYARSLDEQDELAEFKDRFVFDDPELIYMDGNSLGRLPKESIPLSRNLVETQWGSRLIRSWNENWIGLSQRVGAKIARLLGARPDEVLVADSTSVNLYKLARAALHARPGRNKIVTDDLNFPSDLYIFQGLAASLPGPCRVEIVKSPDGIHGPVEGLLEAIDADTALVSLSHTCFKSAYTYDMAAISAHAHHMGALTLWDLSHSAGSLVVELDEAGADLAVGCTYKYLNGGPGAPAFLYVRKSLQAALQNPVSGWFGQQNAFEFGLDYQPAPGLARFLTGTPPVLSLAPVEVGVDLLLEAGMPRLREKSVRQTDYLIGLWRALLAPLGFDMNSPPDPAWRGSHVSLGHPDGWRVAQALIEEMKVLPDFRRPDNIRLGVAPLYTAFIDLHEAATRLCRVVKERRYEKYSSEFGGVT